MVDLIYDLHLRPLAITITIGDAYGERNAERYSVTWIHQNRGCLCGAVCSSKAILVPR